MVIVKFGVSKVAVGESSIEIRVDSKVTENLKGFSIEIIPVIIKFTAEVAKREEDLHQMVVDGGGKEEQQLAY